MFELTLKVLLSHLLGDFVFQPNKMVDEIQRKKLRSGYLYLHALIHLSLLLLLTQFERQYIGGAIVLSVSHLGIDIATKIFLKRKMSSLANFALDQSLHLLTIMLFVKYYHDYSIDWQLLLTSSNYLFVAALTAVTFVSAVAIKKIMEIFNYELPNEGIKEAGKYIGMLERLFIFVFIISSFWQGVGFLLAAKSIFRFGDLTKNNEIRLTEYILIGTLVSFGFAILIAQAYLELKRFL